MTAICYSGPISAIPINERFFAAKSTFAKFQCDISNTEGLVRVYTENRLSSVNHLYVHFIWSTMFPSGCYKLNSRFDLSSGSFGKPSFLKLVSRMQRSLLRTQNI